MGYFLDTKKTILENAGAAATGAGSISGFRGSLFGSEVVKQPPLHQQPIALSPYATTRKKKRKMKKTLRAISETAELDVVTTNGLKELLRSKQQQRELRDTTELFAIEDEDGGIVKVYVHRDQAEQFKHTLEQMLADDDGREVAELLFALHKSFDIVSVDWGTNTIPEDEEQPKDQVANSEDADENDYPDTEELGDVEASEQDPSMDDETGIDLEAGDDIGDMEGMDNMGDTQSQDTLLSQIVQLLKAQVDAQRAEAEAAKAKADVDAAEAAARAAQQYAAHQEEVMDMENYVKRQAEDKRENQIQAKLMRYRHDLRKDKTADLQDKLKDPEFLLNTLHKISIGESTMTTAITPPTPEEEEILHMEDWEKTQKEEKKNMKLRDRLMRYRHAQGKVKPEEEEVPAEQMQQPGEQKEEQSDVRGMSLRDFLFRSTSSQE